MPTTKGARARRMSPVSEIARRWGVSKCQMDKLNLLRDFRTDPHGRGSLRTWITTSDLISSVRHSPQANMGSATRRMVCEPWDIRERKQNTPMALARRVGPRPRFRPIALHINLRLAASCLRPVTLGGLSTRAPSEPAVAAR